MSNSNVPLPSLEVRWFFEGGIDEHRTVKDWFESTRRSDVGPPEWKDRLHDEPDLYLLIPGAGDLGIKWREGELQVKGRVAKMGTQLFCKKFEGKVERWIKWSYAALPEPYQRIFTEAQQNQLNMIAVSKTRALRKIRLDTSGAAPVEVKPKEFVDRGLGFELTGLRVDGQSYCSLAFEAFPDDSGMPDAFTRAVEWLLADLDRVELSASNSQAFPEWLGSIGRQ